MGDDFSWPTLFFLGIFCVAVLSLGSCQNVHERAYKQGQIDAANGIMKYELQQLPTGETVWVKKGEQ